MRRIEYDEHPFWEKGVAGAFALGALSEVSDGLNDGERIAWTLISPLGVELRPKSPIRAHEGPRVPYAEQARIKTQWQEAAAAIALNVMNAFPACVAVLGEHERSLWEAKIAVCSWQPCMQRYASAWFGNSYCDGRLDLVFSDRAQARGVGAWWPVASAVDRLLHPHHGRGRDNQPVDPWWQARSAGSMAAAMARLLGEPGWTTLEQIATMTRGGMIWSRTAQRDGVNPRTAQETK